METRQLGSVNMLATVNRDATNLLVVLLSPVQGMEEAEPKTETVEQLLLRIYLVSNTKKIMII